MNKRRPISLNKPPLRTRSTPRLFFGLLSRVIGFVLMALLCASLYSRGMIFMEQGEPLYGTLTLLLGMALLALTFHVLFKHDHF